MGNCGSGCPAGLLVGQVKGRAQQPARACSWQGGAPVGEEGLAVGLVP